MTLPTLLPESPGHLSTIVNAQDHYLQANTDAEAVMQWLSEYRATPQTFRTYRKEAERLLLWLADRGQALGDIRRHDIDAFEAFLSDPQPASRWIGTVRKRTSPEWRPFRGPLGPTSRRQALVILQAMFSWLVDAGWIGHNPFALMRDKRRRMGMGQKRIERYLERPLWDWVWQYVDRSATPQESDRQRYQRERLRFVFAFAYLMGPRISEMANAKMSDFQRAEGQWWWHVVGKGAKAARVPVTPAMLMRLRQWREVLGMSALPHGEEHDPLIRTIGRCKGMTDNQLYRLITATFHEAADALQANPSCFGDPGANVDDVAARLRKASPHWLRHTAVTHQAQSGVELRYLASTARHSRLDTTALYLHTEDHEWRKQLAGHDVSMS